MKRILLFILLYSILAGNIYAQSPDQSFAGLQPISQANVDLRGAPVTLGQLSINAPSEGFVIVRFDGLCYASPGDRIVLAASDNQGWAPDDGNVSIEVIDSDLNHKPFSHTMVYNVAAGSHTYYAVGQNYVEMDGDGIASVYGSLTVKFFPSIGGQDFAAHEGIALTNIDVRGETITLGQISFNTPYAGKVYLRFDGTCIASPGDRIVLAASNSPAWGANDGAVTLEVHDADINRESFSHSRVYLVEAGQNDFYAVAQNYIELDGSGFISLYGSLTLEYFPMNVANASAWQQSVNQVDVNMRGFPLTLGQYIITVNEPGSVVVGFDGTCIASPGDRIVLAANDEPYWTANDGNTSIEVFDDDMNRRPFSHTRFYEVLPGSYTFYAVGQNYVELDGTGIASVYGTLTVEYFTGALLHTADFLLDEGNIVISPNPVKDITNVSITSHHSTPVRIELYDLAGIKVRSYSFNLDADRNNFRLDLSYLKSGAYFITITSAKNYLTKRLIKL